MRKSPKALILWWVFSNSHGHDSSHRISEMNYFIEHYRDEYSTFSMFWGPFHPCFTWGYLYNILHYLKANKWKDQWLLSREVSPPFSPGTPPWKVANTAHKLLDCACADYCVSNIFFFLELICNTTNKCWHQTVNFLLSLQ